jgi:hypothetical protein
MPQTLSPTSTAARHVSRWLVLVFLAACFCVHVSPPSRPLRRSQMLSHNFFHKKPKKNGSALWSQRNAKNVSQH